MPILPELFFLKKISPKTITLLLPLLLAGCASQQWENVKKTSSVQKYKHQLTSDINGMNNKIYQKSVVEYRYIPVPVPGQLMSMPSAKDIKKSTVLTGIGAVEQANKKALQEPKTDQFFNSMLTYAFMPSAVYTIYTATGKITDIVLEKGENIRNIAVSDSANWQVQTSSSGKGKSEIKHILVKPMIAESADNTIVIMTEKRTYHLYLKITKNDVFMISVQWTYPNADGSMFLTERSEDNQKASPNTVNDVVDPATVSFSYEWAVMTKSRPDWYPVQIFHDSVKTYIRFPKSFGNQMDLPIIYIPDGNGGYSTMSNWRLINKDTMVVDGVLSKALLETGSKKGKRSRVEIRMKKEEDKGKNASVSMGGR